MEKINKVLANVQQSLTDAEKAQARTNIGAAAASDVVGKNVYVDWDGTSDKFADIEAIVAAGDVPVVRYNNYDYVCTDSQNDGRFVFMSELGEGGVFAFIQFFRDGATPLYKTVPLALPYHTDTDVGKILGLVQGTTNSEPAWVTPSGSVPTPGANDLTKSLQVTGTSGEFGWRTQSEVRVKEGAGSGITYTQLDQFTVGTGRSEVYGRKDGENNVTMLGLLGPYPTSSDDTGKFLRCTYSPNNNCYATWANPEPICDLKILEAQNVHYTTGGNKTLTIADEYSYHISIDAPVVVTLATNSQDTVHSVISVKTSATNVCAGIEIVWYDETLSEHGLTVDLTESNKTYFFDVYIRKVFTQSSSYSIARLYDFPCAYRQSPFTSSTLDNNTNFIGRWM